MTRNILYERFVYVCVLVFLLGVVAGCRSECKRKCCQRVVDRDAVHIFYDSSKPDKGILLIKRAMDDEEYPVDTRMLHADKIQITKITSELVEIILSHVQDYAYDSALSLHMMDTGASGRPSVKNIKRSTMTFPSSKVVYINGKQMPLSDASRTFPNPNQLPQSHSPLNDQTD